MSDEELEELITVIREGDVSELQRMLYHVPSYINDKSSCGDTPFMAACRCGSTNATELLMHPRFQCDTNVSLPLAAQSGSLTLLRKLLADGKRNINERDKIEFLEFNQTSPLGPPAIMIAAKLSREAFLLLLSVRACDPFLGSSDSNPLIEAASGGIVDNLAYYLNAKKIDINDTSKIKGDTALHAAAESGHYELIPILVAHGAHINKQNIAGQTPILKSSSLKCIETFLSFKECDANILDKYNNSTLSQLLHYNGGSDGMLACASLVLSRISAATVNVPVTESTDTVLISALGQTPDRSMTELAWALVMDPRCDIKIRRQRDQKSAFAIAATSLIRGGTLYLPHKELIEALVARGATVDERDIFWYERLETAIGRKDETALSIALAEVSVELPTFLKTEYGQPPMKPVDRLMQFAFQIPTLPSGNVFLCLLQAGANPNGITGKLNPLTVAISNAAAPDQLQLDVLKAFIDSGANLNVGSFYSLVSHALNKKRPQAAMLLIKSGCDVDRDKGDPVQAAANIILGLQRKTDESSKELIYQNMAVASELLTRSKREREIDVDSSLMATLLVANGCPINELDRFRRGKPFVFRFVETPLAGTRQQRIDTFRIALDGGMEVGADDYTGTSPLTMAMRCGWNELALMLLDEGCRHTAQEKAILMNIRNGGGRLRTF